ncbi:MAG TPA: tetratricopeptide repeat protein [Adhaeribacter sp.]|nr:tetratricopeptide repeat protein [Adhaeribacter sp.]
MANKSTTNPRSTDPKAAKAQHEYELLENPDALADRISQSEDFVKKHKNTLLGIFVAIALLIAAGFAYYSYQKNQEVEAQNALYPAVYQFEADSLNKALAGDARFMGLVAVADEYSGTKAGKLASFYAGVALLKQGKFQEAIDRLEDFSSDDLILQGRAYSLIGDANMELGKNEEAANMYQKAANYKSNEYFAPAYLMKAGMAYEAGNQFGKAVEAYDKIITSYAAAAEVNDAKKHKARAEELAAAK